MKRQDIIYLFCVTIL